MPSYCGGETSATSTNFTESFEGQIEDIAKWLNSNGIVAVVLKYRLPNAKSNIISYKSPLLDASRAMKIIRKNAEDWLIDKNNIGVMGFSAGGHLASTLSTHYDEDGNPQSDSIDLISSRPDFMVLMYPVITMDESFTHMGSRKNLLGENPSQELVDYLLEKEIIELDELIGYAINKQFTWVFKLDIFDTNEKLITISERLIKEDAHFLALAFITKYFGSLKKVLTFTEKIQDVNNTWLLFTNYIQVMTYDSHYFTEHKGYENKVVSIQEFYNKKKPSVKLQNDIIIAE